MINTQKLTSLVFHIRDGKMGGSDLAPSSVKHALKRMPLPHEFLSYLFSFHSITCGPFCFYKDYIAFIDGSHFKDIPNPRRPPKPTIAIFRKLLLAAFFGFLTVFVAPYWPCTLLTDEKFAEESFLYKNFLLVFVSTLHRYKYYFAWILAEASNLSAGLGFNGYDANGHAKWDLIDNVVVLKTEFAVNMKQFIDNWNKSTTIWLRYLVYDRTGKTMMVFVISALWHGFYPGYYITFLSAGVFIIAARKIRKLLQPHFQVTKAMSILHDIVSCPVTGLSMCYIGFPFMLLLGKPVLYVYWHLYFYMHILVIVVLIFFKIVNVKPYQMKSY